MQEAAFLLSQAAARIESLTTGCYPSEDDPGSHDDMQQCTNCGRRYLTVYSVPDEVWRRIQPGFVPDNGLLLCPTCADRIAREHGVPLEWHAVPAGRPDKLQQMNSWTAEQGIYFLGQVRRLVARGIPEERAEEIALVETERFLTMDPQTGEVTEGTKNPKGSTRD